MRGRGLPSFFVRVLEANPFRRFYEKLGGRIVGHEDLVIDGRPYAELLYGWDSIPAA
jgi:hypothetical protein